MSVKDIYDSYTSMSSKQIGIDGARFSKMCKDLRLFDEFFRKEDVDIVFAKYKVISMIIFSF
jgi:hypothetical protein